jgi:NAD(P)-dependent dehydrogenase (short-subunit alcohol dehydrogenase family)
MARRESKAAVITGAGGDATAVEVDVSDEDQVGAVVAAALDTGPRPRS